MVRLRSELCPNRLAVHTRRIYGAAGRLGYKLRAAFAWHRFATILGTTMSATYQNITLDPSKRSGKPTIRGMRITVYDVLSYLAAGMSREQIVADFPYLTDDDVQACLSYAADRERRLLVSNTGEKIN